jgi:hypothetical protein
MLHIDADLTVTRNIGMGPQTFTIPVPQVDLATYARPGCDGEWGIGCPRPWIGAGYPILASAFPRPRDRTVVQIHQGFRRDEIPRLIALLSAVYAEAWPEPDDDPGPTPDDRGEDTGRHRRGRRRAR